MVATVVSLHGLALAAMDTDAVEAPPGPAALSVRWIEPAPVEPVTTAPPGVVPAAPQGPVEPVVVPPRRVHRPSASVAAKTREPSAPEATDIVAPTLVAQAAPPEPTETLGSPTAGRPPPSVDASAVPPPAPAASGPIAPESPIPVYKTRLAPPATLHYELRRGGITGNGDLQWRPQDRAYELKLEGKVAGITLLTQTSQGQIDANGIAPLRFTDQRTRRAAQAANFQRDKGVISFSGPTDQYVLVPGTQDRLSWMLQLGAIVAADPGRAKPGQKVALYVVGSRGEVDTWVLDFAGVETVQAAGTSVKALKFMREARKPMDSHIEIWLDPARHYLPVHAKQASGTDGSGDVFELLLRDAESTP